MSVARRRLRSFVVALALAGLVLGVIAVDARVRTSAGHEAEERNAAIVRATGLPELALSTTSSWLRHPALAAPSAGASEAPLGLDVDPAGAVIPRRAREREILLRLDVP